MPKATRCLVMLLLFTVVSCGPRNGSDPSSDGFRWPAQLQTAADRRREADLKLARVMDLMHRERISGILLANAANFAWITAGGDGQGRALLFLRDDGKRYVIGNEAQVRRLLAEDLSGLGYEGHVVPWYLGEPGAAAGESGLAALVGERPIGADTAFGRARPLAGDVNELRTPLTDQEINKYRWLGKACAEALRENADGIKPRVTERGIESPISASLLRRAIRPVAVQVASDERLEVMGETPPSDAGKVERILRIAIRAERWGLAVALTRIVHFGPPPSDVQQKYESAAGVCAGFWARTLKGVTAGTILQGAISDYFQSGFPNEWKESDQGGAVGYGGWDWLAVPGSSRVCKDRQTFAWHPGIRGLQLEDTILVSGDGLEVLTEIPGWPVLEVKKLDRVYRLPGILVR